MSDYTVREATATDVAGIRRVAERGWRTAYGDLLRAETIDAAMGEWYDADRLTDRVEDGETAYYVAVSGDSVVGFVTGGPGEAESVGFLGALYVDPEHWREGIGSALLDTFEQFCRDRGFERIQFGVLAGNDLGQSFYRGRGYERVDDREGDLFGETETELVFARELA